MAHDDDAPEVVSRSTSKADAKRNEKVLREFEAEEIARRKARNRERDQKLKERARVTRGEKRKEVGVRFLEEVVEDDGDEDDVEARMLRAMRDAADEVESDEGGDDDDDDDGDEFDVSGHRMDSGNDMSSVNSSGDDDDAEMSLGEGDPAEDEGVANILRSNRKADYLSDDLFAAAFAFQDTKPAPKKDAESIPRQTVKKRRRKSVARPKDLVIGGRTIRTLPQLSDPRSQATARSVPTARARRFVDNSLAIKGKKALLKAKKKGWERRPANVGVMKYHGAPHGFARSMR